MAKTGFEKFAEKNRMPEIRINRPVADDEPAPMAKAEAGERGSARVKGGRQSEVKKKTTVLLYIDPDLKERLSKIKEETHCSSLNGMFTQILANYADEYERNRQR